MKRTRKCRRPCDSNQFSPWVIGASICVIVVISAGLSADDPATDVFRVEEDWAMVVNDPDLNSNGPQVTCTISPCQINAAYAAFDINYRTQPNYESGGLQLHAWDPEDAIVIASSPHADIMLTPGEAVTWTQTMTLQDDRLTFRVVDGTSTTWGTFGGHESHLRLVLSTNLVNLNQYDPQVSLDNSGVSFASNLVDSLTLVAVRCYDVNGNLIKQITNPQAVHPRN